MTLEVHNITWRGVEIEIVYAEKKFGVIDHIELRTEGKAPLPVTETGYRSEYFALGTVAEYGGVVPLVTAWLDHEAERVKWHGSQLSLFWGRKNSRLASRPVAGFPKSILWKTRTAN